MSFKTLFDKASGIKSLANKSAEEIGNEIESVGYHTADILEEQRFIPQVDFTKPESFARFGSAEEYYVESVDRITEQFPYDGSLKERLDWENDSTYIDLHIYNNLYPRTTGYITMSIDPAVSNRVDGYGVPDVAEYISLKGGPHTNQDSGMNPYSTNFTGSNYLESSKNRESNLKYDLSGSGVSLEFWLKKDNFDTNTTHKEVIFDLWNGQNSSLADYGRLRLELTASGELDGTPGAGGRNAFLLTVLSGTTGFVSSSITSQTLTTSSIADGNWHHYAVSLLSGAAGITGSFYVDGELENQFVSGTLRVDIDGPGGDVGAINEVTGALSAYIGALRTSISGNDSTAAGYGKLAASLDEFRYWKTQRSSKDIGRFWFTQVGGGTNTDTPPFSDDSNKEMVNTHLGVYYKFNEGITGYSSTDSVVLDFSGRVTNGAWTGYTSQSRNTGSAIISSSAAAKEFEDPIIYSFHPLVTTLRDNLELSGSSYDVINNSSLYNSIPAWITEADMEGQKQLRYLTQIMGSYFDTLQLQMETLNKFRDVSYVSSSEKPLPFAEKMLNSAGFVSPEIFLDADILEVLGDRSEDIVYEKSLNDIKNIVYKNIYNNLTYIFKSKGTEKAFRNLIRCFGIDDELVKLNLYATDTVYRYRENRRNVVVADKTVNFNRKQNMGGVVYNASSSTNVDGFSYIPANTFLTGGYATTLETEVFFPLKADTSEDTYVNTNVISSSLFGLHRTAELANDPAWDPAGDNANFQVYAVRDELESANAHFLLTGVGATLIPPLTSSLYEDLYDNNSWQLAVSIKPLEYPLVPYISSSSDSPTTRDDYLVVFRGVQTDSGEIINSFTATGSIAAPPASFVTSSRRTYVGAHRTNFTGAVLSLSDVRINSSRYWLNYLDDAALTAHAYDTENHGALYPHKYAYPFDPTASFGEILNFDTLMFNWEFSQNTGSDAYGIFQVADESSGSSQFMSASSYTSGAFGLPGKLLNKKYTAQGYGFEASNTGSIRKEHVISAKLNPLEVINSVDQVKVLSVQEHQEFYLDSRPVNYFFSFEKSMYRTISEEIVNYFGTLRDFNNIIGEPVNRYRPNYKLMGLLRNRFFAQVSNSEIDFNKFYEFYKWFDSSLSYMLGQLVPVSADFAENVRTMIESHELERNKYKSAFQFMDEEKTVFEAALQSNVDYGGAISSPDDDKSLGFWPSSAPTRRQLGLSPRALTKVWEDTSAPVDAGVAGSAATAQQQRYLWWKNKTERTSSALASPFSDDFNRSRVRLFKTIKQTIDRLAVCPYRFAIEGNRTLGGVGAPAGQKVNFVFAATTPFGPEASDYLEKVMVAKRADLEILLNTTDRFYGPNFKQRLGLTFDPSFNTPSADDSLKYTGANLSPFSVYSSSVSTGYVADIASGYTGGIDFTNLHHDFVANTDVPLQGPFPEKFVGGRFYRHVDISDGTDTVATRQEGFRIQFDGVKDSAGSSMTNIVAILPPDSLGTVTTTDANIPRGNRFRDETAKRPFNIKNILMTTSSAGVRLSGTIMHSSIGNYQRNYQVVQTCGRTANDPYFRDQSFTFAVRALASNQTVRGRFPLTESTLGVNPGFTEFELPERTGSNSNQTVIVNRFASPGSYAVDSLGYMAPPAEELSVYNALPYRNLEVINYGLSGSASSDPSIAQSIAVIDQISKNRGLNQRSSLHCGQYGSDAAYGLITATSTRTDGGLGYVATPSWHKVNRNRKQRMMSGSATGNGLYTGSVYDNLFVQHPIPRSFQQYAWVTASVTGNAIMGLQPPTCLSASTYSQFLTSSDAHTIAAGGKGPDPYVNDFVGLRRLILDPVTASTHTLGFVAECENPDSCFDAPLSSYVNHDYIVANALAGTFAGGIAFQALMLNRSGPYQYPTWKQMRLGSHPVVRKLRKTNTISVVDSPPLLESGLGYSTRGKSANTFTDFTEQPLSSRHIPALVVAEKRAGDETFQDEGVYQLSYGNNLDMFSHESLNNRLNLETSKKEIYDNPFVSMVEYFLSSRANLLVDYGERVYPAEKVAYRNIVRNRTNFTITGAFDPARTVAERANSQGHVITSSAAWFLREEENFTTVAPALSSREQGAGEGQSIQGRYGVPDSYDITASAQYNMRIPIGWNADRTALIYGGTTKWQVAEQSSRLPYVDYNNWVHQLRLKAKDYSIVPEFRISEHIADIINDGGNPLIDNWRLDITGAEYPNSNVDRFFETYTNGEFCKLFKVVDSMLYDTGTGDQKLKRNKISLQCNAAKKLLPYPDFYPIQQFQKLAQQFSQSYGPYINTTASADTADIPLAAGYRAFLDPFFSPGIWFNTYKSGLGVGSYVLLISGGADLDINDVAKFSGVNSANSAFPEGVINFGSGSILSCSATASNIDYSPYRVPFEAIYQPQLLNTKIISGSYIYDNGVGSGSLSGNTDGTYTLNRVAWEGQGNDLYRMMADNTLSSIYDLFIENPVSFISNTQDKFSTLNVTEGEAFAMTFNIQRSLDATGSADRSKFEMYSRNTAFGPPVALDNGTAVGGTTTLEYSASTSPSTPCYINGTASVTVVATASFAGEQFLSDLLASAEYIYSTQLESDSYSESAMASWFAQTISESFNLSERLGQENSSRWMIQSKFETPVLNFADVSATDPAEAAHPIQPGSTQGITTKGMGHQYGRITKGDEGIDCYIDTPEFVVSPTYGRLTRPRSLAKLVGFPEGIKKKVGVLKNEVLLEEAVVVVPFIQLNTRRKFLTFPRARVKLNSYQNLLSAMDKYIFPPKFDFTRFKEVKPVLMYVFEFEHALTQENLSSWWQGAFPGQPNVDCHLCGCTDTEFELKEVQIEEKELVDKILGCDKDLHWMVFKVKKRAARNFEKLRRSFVTDDLSDIPAAVGEYTYNWPYDNFSLVELVKIEQQVRWLSDEVSGPPCPDPEADIPTPSPAPQRAPSATPPTPLLVSGRGLPDPDTGRKAQTTEKVTPTAAPTTTTATATPRVPQATVDPDAVLSQTRGTTLSDAGETGGDSVIKKGKDG